MFIASILLVVCCTINLASCMLQHLSSQMYVVASNIASFMLQHLSYQLVVCCTASIFLVESCTNNLTSLFVVASICMLGVCYSFYLACCKLQHLYACCMLQHHIQLAVCCSIYLARCMLQHLSSQLYVAASILLVVCCSIYLTSYIIFCLLLV